MSSTRRTQVSQVLSAFDGEFADVAQSVAEGQYVLWLGSGVSRDVVPNVSELLERLLEYLRSGIAPMAHQCRFRDALEEVLGYADRSCSTVDLTLPVADWTDRESILKRLVNQYADVLDVRVKGEACDFLIWDALNLPAVYADTSLAPDIEHMCVAILMLERAVPEVVTTNWDALVESALTRLVGAPDGFLDVVVRAEDFSGAPTPLRIVKFHGCAKRALNDSGTYRALLIARQPQISKWGAQPENQMMKRYLEHLMASRAIFLIGLSAQDENIHTMFSQATVNLPRSWPASPPALVFSEQLIHQNHKLAMNLVYGDSCYSDHREEIDKSALLGAFAKPTLVALVLYTLGAKFQKFLEHAVPGLPDSESERLSKHLLSLRDRLGLLADQDPHSFVERLVESLPLLMSVFRHGRPVLANEPQYQPLSTMSIAAKAVHEPDFPAQALGHLALALSFFARGEAQEGWQLTPGSSCSLADGVVIAQGSGNASKVFAVRNGLGLAELQSNGGVDMQDNSVLILQSEPIAAQVTRSPGSRFGGGGGARHVDMTVVAKSGMSADELFEVFKQEAVLP